MENECQRGRSLCLERATPNRGLQLCTELLNGIKTMSTYYVSKR